MAAILLGVAGILTAWAAYNAALTDGDALKGYTESATSTADANFFYNQGNQSVASDSGTFLQYALEIERGNPEIADLVRLNLFSPELQVATDAWDQLAAGESPATPLLVEEYQVEAFANADALTETAKLQFADAFAADEAGDKFELAAVFLAVSLFLAGIASLFKVYPIRLAMLGASVLLIVPGIIAIIQGHAAI
ncbi:MAG: hypothetical protein ACR2HQ_08725 [Ilumatobacteraceae bacterium]